VRWIEPQKLARLRSSFGPAVGPEQLCELYSELLPPGEAPAEPCCQITGQPPQAKLGCVSEEDEEEGEEMKRGADFEVDADVRRQLVSHNQGAVYTDGVVII
jgi:hypothetical protein